MRPLPTTPPPLPSRDKSLLRINSMQERGVEPLHLSVQDPKSCASANSATPAGTEKKGLERFYARGQMTRRRGMRRNKKVPASPTPGSRDLNLSDPKVTGDFLPVLTPKFVLLLLTFLS